MKIKTNLLKVLSLIFAVVIMAASFAGCSGSGKRNIKGKKEIQIAYWQAGYGEEWLKAIIEAFEAKYPDYYVNYQATASHASVIAPFGMDDVDKNDLYLDIKNMDTEYMEPLDDILATTADGDQKTIGEKMNQSYLAYEKSSDGKCYTLSYGGGIMGFYYNADLLKKAGITQFPRTTNELVAACDKLYGKGITPLCHFTGGGYYVYLLEEYMAQYDGFDYYMNNFFACKDENGTSPSKSVLTKKDGRYYALKAFEKFITPEYTLAGSNTMSHTEIQTQFLQKSAAMMLNGTWVANEMNIDKDDKTVKCAKLPVLSAVVNNLSTVKSDSDLRKVIDAVDSITDGKKQDFFLLGEVLHGEYGRMLNDMHIHSLTNYQCYKGIHSGFNSANMFEIIHSLLRLFEDQQWAVCRGAHLLSFADNHDVSRIATLIQDPNCLPLVYAMVYGMPGIPCVYYGSEWGTKADKSQGDPALRPSFDKPEWNELTDFIAKLSEAKKNSKALNYGGMRSIVLQNKQCIFERRCDDERVLVAINMDSNPFTAHFDAGCGQATDLITGNLHDFGGGSTLPPYSAQFWKMER